MGFGGNYYNATISQGARFYNTFGKDVGIVYSHGQGSKDSNFRIKVYNESGTNIFDIWETFQEGTGLTDFFILPKGYSMVSNGGIRIDSGIKILR